MSNNLHWTPEQMAKMGLVEINGEYVKVSSVTHKGKVDKLPNLIERAIQPIAPKAIPDFAKPHYDKWAEQDRDIKPDKIIVDQSEPAFNNKLLQGRIDELNAQQAFEALSGKKTPIVLPHVAMKQFIKDEFAKIEPTANRKIKNATKTVVNGISFDSRLEAYLHGLLTAAGIYFEFQKKFELQAKFRYRDENIRAIYIVFDFYLAERNILIDSKGWQTYDGKMKHKMLKSVLKHLHNMQPEILMPKNKKECDEVLNRLLYGN